MWKTILLVVWLGIMVVGCGAGVQPTPTLIFEQTETPPVSAVPPTAVPPRTRVPRTPNPNRTRVPKPTMMGQADARATISARATASPVPTPRPGVVRDGIQYGIDVERGTLLMEVRLSGNPLMTGESGQATITLHNRGTETIWLTGDLQSVFQIVLLDEQGHETAVYPWQQMVMPGMPQAAQIKAGEGYSDDVSFQIPPPELTGSHTLELWGVARFSGTAHENGDSASNLWLPMEAGPIRLQLVPPVPAKQANAELTADRTGWVLRVTDAEGRVLKPAWGFFEAKTENGWTTWLLPPSADGTWRNRWGENWSASNDEIVLRAWVGTKGYLLGTARVAVAGSGAAAHESYAYAPQAQTFDAFEAAQQNLGLPLWGLGTQVKGAVLDRVVIEDYSSGNQQRTKTRQMYQLADRGWMELMQENTTERNANLGWGQARYETDALQVDVGGTMGYLVKRLGWWVLDWKRENVGFELRMKEEQTSQQEVIDAARSAVPYP